jgi:hypothetical protein
VDHPGSCIGNVSYQMAPIILPVQHVD